MPTPHLSRSSVALLALTRLGMLTHQELDGATGLPADPGGSAAPQAPHDPTPGTGQGVAGEGTPPAATPPTSRSFTQSEMDAIIGDRLARERKQNEKRLKELGFESFDQVEELVRTQQKAKEQKLKEQNKWKELYENQQSAHQQKLDELTSELQQIRERSRTTTLQNTLLSSLSGAISPEQAAQLVSGSIKYDDEGTAYPVDTDGKAMSNPDGTPMSVAQYCTTWLENNPHFKKAASGRGAPPLAGQTPQTPGLEAFDPARADDADYVLQFEGAMMAQHGLN